MKKILLLIVAILSIFIATVTSAIVFFNTNITENGNHQVITIAPHESIVFSLSKIIDSISFNKDSGFTIRTLEGGKWIDMSNNPADYTPMKGYLIRNNNSDVLKIDIYAKNITNANETIFQHTLKAGWNLVGPAYKDDEQKMVNIYDFLGGANYSHVADFTGGGFIKEYTLNTYSGEAKIYKKETYSGEIKIPSTTLIEHKVLGHTQIKNKAELANLKTFEGVAYGVFVPNDTIIPGSQNLSSIEDASKSSVAVYVVGPSDNDKFGNNKDNAKIIFNVTGNHSSEEIRVIGLELDGNITKIEDENGNNIEFEKDSGNILLYKFKKAITINNNSFIKIYTNNTNSNIYLEKVYYRHGDFNSIDNNKLEIFEPESSINLGKYTFECDETLAALGLCFFDSSHINEQKVDCSTDNVFSNNSCDICYTMTDKKEGENLGMLGNNWYNNTNATQYFLKSENNFDNSIQIIPLNGAVWSYEPEKEGFWEYTDIFESLEQDEGFYKLNSSNSIEYVKSKLGYSIELKKTAGKGVNAGLLKYTLNIHNDDSGIPLSEIQQINSCTLIKSDTEKNIEKGTLSIINSEVEGGDILAGTKDNLIAAIDFNVENEDIKLKEITFDFFGEGDFSNTFENISVSAGSSTFTGVVVHNSDNHTIIKVIGDIILSKNNGNDNGIGIIVDFKSGNNFGNSTAINYGIFKLEKVLIKKEDAIGVTSNKNIFDSDYEKNINGTAFNIIPAKMNLAVIDTFGPNDNQAKVKIMIDKGNNTFNDDITLSKFSVSGITEIKNNNNDIFHQGDVIHNGDELTLYTGTGSIGTEIFINKANVGFTVDGVEYPTEISENLSLGTYTE